MKHYQIYANIDIAAYNELSQEDCKLIDAAKSATHTSYSPYSRFAVGAALLLDNGEIVCGSNQENASYPVGCCAERSALFWAGGNRSGHTVRAIAIAANNGKDFTPHITAPCGMCRQALAETEHKQGKPIRVLLYSTGGIHILNSVADLLPLSFQADTMDI